MSDRNLGSRRPTETYFPATAPISIGGILSFLLLFGVGPFRSTVRGEPSEEGVRLATIPQKMEISRDLVPTSNRSTFVERWSVRFGPAGDRVAYVVSDGRKMFPVIGEKRGGGFDVVSRPTIAGGRAFFRVGERRTESTESWWVWIDGSKKIGPEDGMGELGVSPDGSRVAYWSQPGAKVGNAAPASYARHQLVVARVGNSERWRPSRGGKWVLPSSTAPVFTVDSKRVFSCARKPAGWVLLMSAGKRESERSSPLPWLDGFAIQPNGASFALVTAASQGAAASGTEVEFRGSKIGSFYDSVQGAVIGPRGKNVATVVSVKSKKTVAINDERGLEGRFDHVFDLSFSPDGTKVAFVGNVRGRISDEVQGFVVGGKSLLVVREVEPRRPWVLGPAYLEIKDLTWDESGARVGFCGRTPEGWRVVCEGALSPPFINVSDPVFSLDGTSVGFGAQDGRELWWKTLPLGRGGSDED